MHRPGLYVASLALRRAHRAARLAFATAGLVIGVLTARLPGLVDKHALSAGQAGAVLLSWGLGALVGICALRPLLLRLGSRQVLSVAAPVAAAALLPVGLAHTYGLALVAMGVFGAAFGTVEITLHRQAAVIERVAGRALFGGLHASWAVGAALGGLAAAASAAVSVSYTATVTATALMTLPAALALRDGLLPEGLAGTGPVAARHGTGRPGVAVLAVLAAAALTVEGAVADWGGLLLGETVGGSQAVAALMYPLFQAGVLSGRFYTDRLRSAVGAGVLLVAAGTVTAAAFAVTASADGALLSLLGVWAAGVGVGPVLPVALSLAGDVGAAAVVTAGTVGYVGLLAGPAAVGAIGAHSSVQVGLSVVVIGLGLLIVVVGRTVGVRVVEPPL